VARTSSKNNVPAVLSALVGVVVLSCSGPPEVEDKELPTTDAVPDATDSTKSQWECIGMLVPPTGWEQHTAFVDKSTANAEQAAADKARAQLVERLCGGATGCDPLRSATTIWKTGHGRGLVCAMAVVEASVLLQWRRANLSTAGLDEQLRRAAAEIIGAIPKKRGRPGAAIGRIFDNGVAGGARADWLKGKMERALAAEGADVKVVKAGWAGVGIPSGVDVVFSAAAFERTENRSKRVEAIWEGRFRQRGGVTKRVGTPVSFPVSAAPGVDTSTPALPPNDPNLSVRVDSRPGGSLCLGDQTQAWLYSAKDLHVRVIDLYGKDGAIVLFPNTDHPDDRINADEKIPLGPAQGFRAFPVKDSEVERFLIIAAESPSDLGRFASITGYCQLPRDIATGLHRGQGIPPNALSASDGFRILSGGDCPEVKFDAAEIDAAIASTPQCH
jgi:hypothetical protein